MSWYCARHSTNINGKKGPAVKAAKRGFKLSEPGEYANDLATMRE